MRIRILDPLVQAYQELTPPDGRPHWVAEQENGARPIFTTKTVASVFFGRTSRWMYRLIQGHNVHYKYELEVPRDEHGIRQFQLHHVELLANELYAAGVIDFERYRNSITIIRAIARNYALI